MDYTAFSTLWGDAFRRAGLLTSQDHADETVDLGSMTRHYSIRLGMFGRQPAEPFTGSMEVRWSWDALKSARSRTTEEDVLTELLGRRGTRRTDRPWLRIDVRLDGKLHWDRPVLLPARAVWQDWAVDVTEQLEDLLPVDDRLPLRAWRGEPEAEVRCGLQGELWLLGVYLEAGQLLELPRQWDDTRRKPDPSPALQLAKTAKRLHGALEIWKKGLKALVPAVKTVN